MGVVRGEKQQYTTVAALVAEVIIPQINDEAMIEATGRSYDWREASTLTPDGVYVIAQTSIATGRWVVPTVVNVYVGSGKTDPMENGQQSIINITVPGVSMARPSLVAVTNADTFNTSVFIKSKDIVAANTVKVVVENGSGATVPIFAVNVSVIEY